MTPARCGGSLPRRSVTSRPYRPGDQDLPGNPDGDQPRAQHLAPPEAAARRLEPGARLRRTLSTRRRTGSPIPCVACRAGASALRDVRVLVPTRALAGARDAPPAAADRRGGGRQSPARSAGCGSHSGGRGEGHRLPPSQSLGSPPADGGWLPWLRCGLAVLVLAAVLAFVAAPALSAAATRSPSWRRDRASRASSTLLVERSVSLASRTGYPARGARLDPRLVTDVAFLIRTAASAPPLPRPARVPAARRLRRHDDQPPRLSRCRGVVGSLRSRRWTTRLAGGGDRQHETTIAVEEPRAPSRLTGACSPVVERVAIYDPPANPAPGAAGAGGEARPLVHQSPAQVSRCSRAGDVLSLARI